MEGAIDCLSGEEHSDKYLGTLYKNESFYCNTDTQRVPVGIFCCSPQPPDKVRFFAYTPDGNMDDTEIKFYHEDGAKMFEDQIKVVYIIHGFMERITNSRFINNTR